MWGLEWLSLSGFFSKEAQEPHLTGKAVEAERPQLESRNSVPDEATEFSSSDRPEKEHESPFLRLPGELRAMIYDFALQDTLNAAAAIETRIENGERGPRLEQPLFAPFVGALALRQTNRKLRNEGLDIMIPLAYAKVENIRTDSDLADAHARDQTEELNLEEAQAFSDAWSDAYSLIDLLEELDSPGYCPVEQQWDARWCKLEWEEKLSIVQARYDGASRDEKEMYDRIADGREDKWEDMAEFEDSFVDGRRNKKYI